MKNDPKTNKTLKINHLIKNNFKKSYSLFLSIPSKSVDLSLFQKKSNNKGLLYLFKKLILCLKIKKTVCFF